MLNAKAMYHDAGFAEDQDGKSRFQCAGTEQDTASIVDRCDSIRAIIHWYSGPPDVLDQMVDAGSIFSVGVEMLHSDYVRNMAAATPTNQLLTETDNPGGPRR